MTTKPQTGGPAFPTEYFYDDATGHERMPTEGMTLRDYFAAKAMEGMFVTAVDWIPTGTGADQESLAIFADLAADAYAVADAMLKARAS